MYGLEKSIVDIGLIFTVINTLLLWLVLSLFIAIIQVYWITNSKKMSVLNENNYVATWKKFLLLLTSLANFLIVMGWYNALAVKLGGGALWNFYVDFLNNFYIFYSFWTLSALITFIVISYTKKPE